MNEREGRGYRALYLYFFISYIARSFPALAPKLYAEKGIKNPACIVDCNHANSGKQYLEQIRIAKEVLHSKRHSNDINALVKGLMIESYIEDGNQKISEGTYGKSITDACLGWEKSEKLVLELADLL